VADDEFPQRAEGPPRGLLVELWDFLREHRKWWLTPILLALLLLGALVLLGGTGAGPFLYSLF